MEKIYKKVVSKNLKQVISYPRKSGLDDLSMANQEEVSGHTTWQWSCDLK